MPPSLLRQDATHGAAPDHPLWWRRHAVVAAVARSHTEASLAGAGWLATFGISPTHPETGYGYIECGDAAGVNDSFRVRRFVEKPPLVDATAYLVAGNYVWNSGMFCFTPAAILTAFA